MNGEEGTPGFKPVEPASAPGGIVGRACPVCGKPVVGESAMHGHLEFAHQIDDPVRYLEALNAPPPKERKLGKLIVRFVRILGLALLVVALGFGAFLGYDQFFGDDDSTATGVDGAPDTGDTRPDGPSPDDTTSTTAPPTTTTVPGSDVPFRAPFVSDAAVDGCERRGGKAVHAVSFVFTGATNITLDGEFYPDDTGNGPHTISVPIDQGTSTYLDRIQVIDPTGAAHAARVSPPLYLSGC